MDVYVINDYDYAKELSKYINIGSSNSTSKTDSDSTNNAGTEQNSTTQTSSGGFDRAKAEEEFALVNQKRSENGVAPLTWDEGMYELACTRAQECVQSFSHTRPDGTLVSETYYYG